MHPLVILGDLKTVPPKSPNKKKNNTFPLPDLTTAVPQLQR